MKTIVKISAILLLFINGFGAVYGGFMLISDPSGSKIQLPLSFLEHTPFNNYLIPGIMLSIINGIFSFVAIVSIAMKKRYCHLFVLAQGILLSGWIIIQMILLKMFYAPMHLPFLLLGACLIGCGFYIKSNSNTWIYKSLYHNN